MKTLRNLTVQTTSLTSNNKLQLNHQIKFLGFLSLLLLLFAPMLSSSLTAQNVNSSTKVLKTTSNGIIVKGTVKDGSTPIPDVSVNLKGTKVGTTTDSRGNFTFPKALNPGDVLIFSYLGYTSKEVKIKKNTTSLNVNLEIEIEELELVIVGALDNGKIYKSKRKKKAAN